jgi:hypothetical protein
VLVQEPQHPIAGYLALLVIALFLTGVFLLPRREDTRLARRSAHESLIRREPVSSSDL